MSEENKIRLEEIGVQANSNLKTIHVAREEALTVSRELIRNAANSIRATHRADYKEAHILITKVRNLASRFDLIRDAYPSVYYGGYVEDALKEYAEASIALAIAEQTVIPGPEDLGINAAPYLNGLAEVIGELRRAILDGLRKDEFTRCEELLETMDDIYTILVTIDYPDAVTRGLRRSTDVARSILERTRGDLTLSIRQHKLESMLSEVQYNKE